MPAGRGIVIGAAVRTPIGRFGGALAGLGAVELGVVAGRGALASDGLDPVAVDEVIVANARQAGVGPNPGRAMVPGLGLPETVTGTTINMACGSGLKAVAMAAGAIAAGDAGVVLVVGVEAMSQIPYLLRGARWGYRGGHGEVTDALHHDGLICALTGQHMGLTAENVAVRYGISRVESDEYAVSSQRRAAVAVAGGHFAGQIVPVPLDGPASLDSDEHPRPSTTLAKIARLKPVFQDDGVVTAASAAGIADGAAALVVAAEDRAGELGLAPLLRLRGWAAAGLDPSYMGLGPVPATQQVLAELGLDIGALDLIEINEAFAPQVLACQRELGYDPARTNVDGGAIALGHPIGMTGVRLLVALAHALPRVGGRLGLATLCINGGMGFSMVVERSAAAT